MHAIVCIYHVIHVNGTIQIKASGKLLEIGDKISSEDEIVFKTPDAMAALISAEKGRFTLCLSPAILQ